MYALLCVASCILGLCASLPATLLGSFSASAHLPSLTTIISSLVLSAWVHSVFGPNMLVKLAQHRLHLLHVAVAATLHASSVLGCSFAVTKSILQLLAGAFGEPAGAH